jgi:hypothetical protein
MYFVPADEVIEVAKKAGLTAVHREPDQSAGESIESFIYIFRKP